MRRGDNPPRDLRGLALRGTGRPEDGPRSMLSIARAERLKLVLDPFVERFDAKLRIQSDPVALVRRYSDPADQEIAGLLASSFAYGQVGVFMPRIERVLEGMGPSPRRWVEGFEPERERAALEWFSYRFHRAADLRPARGHADDRGGGGEPRRLGGAELGGDGIPPPRTRRLHGEDPELGPGASAGRLRRARGFRPPARRSPARKRVQAPPPLPPLDGAEGRSGSGNLGGTLAPERPGRPPGHASAPDREAPRPHEPARRLLANGGGDHRLPFAPRSGGSGALRLRPLPPRHEWALPGSPGSRPLPLLHPPRRMPGGQGAQIRRWEGCIS